MECVLSGNQIKSFNRAVNCLYRIGSELLIEVLPDKLTLRTLNTAWSAFLAVSFKGQFFDSFHVSSPSASCSVLLKSVCTVFRTAPGSMERLTISLPNGEATKLQWTLDCLNGEPPPVFFKPTKAEHSFIIEHILKLSSGMKKTYWITCNNDTEMQNVLVDRNTLPSHLVANPRDLSRLLTHFQSSLQEITLIATEPVPPDVDTESEAKAIELKSYLDPARDMTDGALHTQLWIDPAEELVEYVHTGAAVDITFSVKELKAFMAFCEGSEANMHMYFEKAGNPVLLAPRFGLDDATHSDFDATLVLATMMGSQLHAEESAGQAHNAGTTNGMSSREGSQQRPNSDGSAKGNERGASSPRSAHRSDETAIWSDLSGSGARTSVSQPRPVPVATNLQDSGGASEEMPLQRQEPISVRRKRLRQTSERESLVDAGLQLLKGQEFPHRESTSGQRQNSAQEGHGRPSEEGPGLPRETTTWEDNSAEDDDDDDDTGGDEFCVPTTPPERRGPY